MRISRAPIAATRAVWSTGYRRISRTPVAAHVAAPSKDFVGWVYADPDGSEHNTVNCSIAEMRITVTQGGQVIAKVPAVAAASVDKQSAWRKFWPF